MKVHKFLRYLLSWFLKTVAVFVVLSALLVVGLRWVDPPITSFMVQHLISDWLDGDDEVFIYHRWVHWEAISSYVPRAVVAAEDQRFPDHFGFDLVEIENALRSYGRTGRLRGASTISQQLAKNLFLWPGQSFVRKGLEAWFTLLIELSLPKRRILELYLNLAQFSGDTFGVGVASVRYFKKPAAKLSLRESSLLAAVLPSPERYRLDAPSTAVRKRAAWIRRQVKNLGAGYLDRL